MAANTLAIGGITYGKINLGGRDYYKDTPIVMLMPKFPGQPILSPIGEPHPGLTRLTPLQRLELAAREYRSTRI